MDLGVRDHVYVLTGASRGLGLATARQLVAEGARVVISSRDPQSVAEAVSALGEAATGLAADNADPATAERLVAAAQERWDRLDGALISVGGPPGGPASQVADEVWRAAFESVFLGAVRLLRTAAAALPGPGSLLLVLSSSVRAPLAGLGVSNGLRPGLAMVAKELADEYGPRGIRVNGLLPGRVATDRLRELDALAGDPVDVRRERSRSIPLRRYGDPEEFGRVAAFLLSPAASYVSGAMVPVDGGASRGL